MKVDVFVLDLSYDVFNGIPEIYIWGIDKDDHRVAIIEKNFRPYFYVLIKDDVPIDEAIDQLKTISKAQSPVTSVSKQNMRYFGKPVNVLRVETVIPAFVRVYREEVSKFKWVAAVLEADIRFYMRYSIDSQVRPFYWLRAEVDEIKRDDLRVHKVYELKSIESVYEDRFPNLRTLAFDIEVLNKYGSPNPRRDPIIVIGVWTDKEYKQFINSDNDDLKIIREFSKFVLDYDPDIILGYNTNGFDWQYLLDRLASRNVKLDVGRKTNSEPSQGTYGHYSIVGRLNVDLYGFAESLTEVKVKSLENVADYLGVYPKDKRVNLEWYQIPEYWEDPKKRDILLKYNLDDAKTTYLLKNVFLTFGEQLTVISGLPLDQLCMASVGYRIEWLLMRESKKFNELIPNRVERKNESYKGGLVIEPKPGLHENVAVLDFSSMYPSIMIKYNIGPDTLVQGECNDCWIAPEVGYKFRRDVNGFYRSILVSLLEERRKVKSELANVNDEYERRRLDERQKALKVMANAMYGYMGWSSARWYSKEGAESVTAWGRELIIRASNIAKEAGFEVVYGDTDSIFVKGNMSDVDNLVSRITKELDLEIKIDKKYKKIFFTKNKKRYAGLTYDGKIDIVGFEAIRGDWCDIAKETQRVVIEKILLSGISEAVKAVKGVIMKMKRKDFDIHGVIIWKSLDKSFEEYEVNAPHVIAAKKALNAGFAIDKLGKIGYIVMKGSGKISDRVEPYFLVKDKNKIDVDYYIEKQIIPSVMRILEPFGIKEDNLKGVTTDIMDYFRDL